MGVAEANGLDEPEETPGDAVAGEAAGLTEAGRTGAELLDVDDEDEPDEAVAGAATRAATG